MKVLLRPESAGDEPFLRRLILDTIADELGASAWPEPMRSHLLEIQYKGRRPVSSAAVSYVVEADGADAGWMVAITTPHEVRVVEIMVQAKLRGKGIGAAAMRGILEGAAAAGKPVRLNVNATNQAAIRFYERLGFRRAGGDEVQHVMECRQ
jgi:ribosomal protein S18 acetylase RimI-like enzyme